MSIGLAGEVVISAGEQTRSLPLQEFLRLGMAAFEGGPFAWASVDTPLDTVADIWALLRALHAGLEDGAQLNVFTSRTDGPMLKRRHAETLFRLSGFELVSVRRRNDGYELVAQRKPVVARPLSCSVIVPCRNEEGNIRSLVERLPAIGTRTELIFVDGNSTDGTVAVIEDEIRAHPDRDIRLLHQRGGGGGKAEAVFQGFDAATGDVLIILDADMTVAPEDLPRFYLAVAENVADFANGTRFAYPMAAGAMPFANTLGNRAFSVLFSWLIDAPITDTLCGTKAFLRKNWPGIKESRLLFGQHDPWGDFDLLLGARYLGLRVVDVPVRYGARTAGESKMRPLRHGPVLARAVWAGIRRFKIESRMRPAGER